MSNNTLENTLADIKIVMIQTSHTGNMGSAARAMKVMGLSNLTLVNPKSAPDEQALAMSSNANDILNNATIVETLSEAVADCQLVVGTSARQDRTLSWDILDARNCSKLIVEKISQNKAKVAILFGRESSGLTNEELAVCQHLVHIPTNPAYSSLNIASAVQILSYECRLAALDNHNIEESDYTETNDEDKLVNADDLEGYFEHLQEVMTDINFIDPKNPRFLIPRLRRLYSRSGISRSEMNILRGMLTAMQKHNSNQP